MTTLNANLISRLSDFWGKIEVLGQVDSTQTMVKEQWVTKPKLPLAIIADSQTHGYGKYGRHFYSPADSGLYFSVALPINHFDSDGGQFTIAAAVIIRRVLLNYFPNQQIDFKWVNDLYLNGKKLAGILVDQLTVGSSYALICGVGINLSTMDFPDELEDKATSLAPGKMIDRNHLMADLLSAIVRLNSCQDYSEIMNEYRHHLPMLGCQVALRRGQDQFTGQVHDIDELGRLVIIDQQGQHRTINSGEVTKVSPKITN